MTTLTFRDATADDVAFIVGMYADDALGATRESPADPLPPEYWSAFREIDDDPRHRLVVVEDAGERVATLQLSFLPHLTHVGTERAQIEAVRVASSRRGTGLGRTIFTWAIEEATRRGCGLVQLTTHAGRADAQRFYASLGFEPTHVGMKLDLGQATGRRPPPAGA